MNKRNVDNIFVKSEIIFVIFLMALFSVETADAQIKKQQTLQHSIKTVYSTKDWVISDFVVTDPMFGAKAEPGFDNRAAFQAAIDAAYESGGGVVYSCFQCFKDTKMRANHNIETLFVKLELVVSNVSKILK